MVEIDIVYAGELHTSCHHRPSGGQLSTDAPVDNQGRGETFSPTDLLATALGTCMLTVMGIVADRNDWSLAGASARVEKHMVADPVRRVGRLVVHLTVPGELPPTAREVLEQAARTCPVSQSIHPSIVTDFVFAWGGPAST